MLMSFLERPPTRVASDSDLFEALRREAGVMFGEVSSPELEDKLQELRVGVLGISLDRGLLLPPNADCVGRAVELWRVGLLTALKAPDRGTLRWKLTVVMRVDVREDRRPREYLDCPRLGVVAEVDRFKARVWREAI